MNKAFSLFMAVLMILIVPINAFAIDQKRITFFGEESNYQELIDGFYDYGLSAVTKDNKSGFIDKHGNIIVPLIYEYVMPFSNGAALVSKDGKVGYVDTNGNIIVPVIYEDGGDFKEGLTWVKKDQKYGFVDKSGKEVVPFKYEFADNFSSGVARVEIGGKSGFVDKSGSLVVAAKYEFAFQMKDDLALVMIDDKWGFVDRTGKEVIPLVYDYAGSFSYGMAWVLKGKNYGFINTNGKEIVPIIYDGAKDFSDGIAAVKRGSKWGFIDQTGKVVIPFEYTDVSQYDVKSRLIQVVKNGKYGFINKEGRETMGAIEYDNAQMFSNGLAAVLKDDKWGFINLKGELVISHKYELANAFEKGLAYVFNGGKGGYIDKTGKFFIPSQEKLTEFFIIVDNDKIGWAYSKYLDTSSMQPDSPKEQLIARTSALPTSSKIIVNGKEVAFEAYRINQNNYFKLRDIAAAISGSEKQFDVAFDAGANAVNIVTGKSYTKAGGELLKGDGKIKAASLSSSRVFLNGKQTGLAAYTIAGNNYFKLRDVMQILDVYVGFDLSSNTISIDTGMGYSD